MHIETFCTCVVPSYLNNNSNLKYNTNTMTMAMWLLVFNNVVNDIGLFVGPYVSFPSIISFQAIPFTSTVFIKTMQFIGILKTFDTFCHLSVQIFWLYGNIWNLGHAGPDLKSTSFLEFCNKEYRLILEFDRFRLV